MKSYIVGLGEALFDLLPTGPVLGGAPLNVAVHVAQLLKLMQDNASQGGPNALLPYSSVMASCVGQDELGAAVIDQLQGFGVATQFLQREAQYPTGVVKVTLQEGQPCYDIVANSAWDHMAWTEDWSDLAHHSAAVCFGSLAQRHTVSRATVRRFLEASQSAIRLFDANLRPPFIDAAILRESCQLATLLKCNEEEIGTLTDCMGLTPQGSSVVDSAQRLREHLRLPFLMLTRGEQGCTLLNQASEVYVGEPVRYPLGPHADAVGAGDATAAVLMLGVLNGWEPQYLVNLANRVGAYVASQRGATPRLPEAILTGC